MELVIDGISVSVNRKKIKNMYLRVKPPKGEVTVSAPMRMPRQDIERFVREKRGWIEKRQETCRENRIRQEKLLEEMKEKMKEKIRQQEQGRDRQEAGQAAQVAGHEDPLGQLQYADRKAVVFADAGLAAPGVRGVCDPPRAGPSLRAQPQRAL